MPLTQAYSFYLTDFLALQCIIYYCICVDLEGNNVLISKLNTPLQNVLTCHNKMSKSIFF